MWGDPVASRTRPNPGATLRQEDFGRIAELTFLRVPDLAAPGSSGESKRDDPSGAGARRPCFPAPERVPSARDSGVPRGPEPHARRPQGPALTGGGSESAGAAAGTVPPRAPGRAAQGGGEGGPKPG